ncbi:hypothetical protein [Roseomonas xinghualingensis]|uniref:hypothetical protein n=1 Tax=Roseomonas xinghualingensis TaxID=2986475 RepID=UPI0021F0F684|nr:hypothetical protein [Roseomonas sp. SXEYE001]MCV4208159.1 hypothetical protein [Roseomonas sp. SXEYE001]
MPHAAWTAARRDILEAFAAGEHLVALIGPSGVGKSLLLREIENSLRSPEFPVLRLERAEWVDAAVAPQVLLVDDAGRMADTALKQLANRVVGFTVVIGLPSFRARLETLPHRVVELGPLRPADVAAYVALRLTRMGLDRARLARGTLEALAEAAGGIPGQMNLLIGASFLVADMAGSQEVRPEHVNEAAALRAESLGLPAEGAPTVAPPEMAVEAEPPPAPSQQPAQPAEPAAPPPAGLSAASSQPPGARPAVPLLDRLRDALADRPWAERLSGVAAVIVISAGLGWLLFSDFRGPSQPMGPIAPQAPLHALGPPPTAEGASVPGTAMAEAPQQAPQQAGAESTPAAPAEQATGAALPTGAMVRVVITYPRGIAEATQRASALSSELDRAGLSVGEPFPISRPPSGPELSYFFREDRDAALRVRQAGAAQLGQTAPRLGPVGTTLPRPGTIELGLPASAGASDERPPPAEEPEMPAPSAAILSGPHDGAVLSAEAGQQGVTLSWLAPGETEPGCCFVEVVAIGGWEGRPREVFAGYAEAADQQLVRLNRPGRYAWRVLTVSRAARRYTATPWRHFVLGEAPP